MANVSSVVRSYINTLGQDASEESGQELERLLTLPTLAHWQHELRGALHDHRTNRRNATYRKATLEEIDRALANQQPANAADLAALVLEQLVELKKRIRDGNTDDYGQYWSYDSSNKKLEKPRPENACRDALLSDLDLKLRHLNIAVEREVDYAEHKRADIKVLLNGSRQIKLPIEIKKDTHRDLWKAMHEQLIPKYTRDPDCDGYGIYLVFWFGGKDMPSDGGKKIKTPQELEQRLREKLSQEEQAHISVCVIDVSLPATSK